MRKLICAILLSLVHFSCNRRELTYDYVSCKVEVNVDWSTLEDKQSQPPSGMTVMFYPQKGGRIIKSQTNNVEQTVVSLQAGVYDVLVFNQITTDFGTVGFKGMDKFASAEVYAKPTDSKWYQTKGDDEVVVRIPEYIAAATVESFEMTEELVEESMSRKNSGETSPLLKINLEPKLVVQDIKLQVKIIAINNLLDTRATLKGISTGYHFASKTSSSNRGVHLLEDWKKSLYGGESKDGEIYTSLSSFGLPNVSSDTRVESNWSGSLEFELLLADNETISKWNVPLSKHIEMNPDSDHNIDILIQVGLSTDTDDKPIELPDVKPEGGGGGFDPDLGDWGDEDIIDLPL